MLLLLSGPPGAGKTTLARLLQERFPEVQLLRTWTTRSPRNDDPDREDYHYTTEADFMAAEAAGSFFETLEFGGFRYGTPKAELEAAANSRDIGLTIINLEGALSIRATYREAIVIYLHATIDELRTRLKRRGEPASSLELRLAYAEKELEQQEFEEADHVLSASGSLEETSAALATAVCQLLREC